MAVNRSVNKSVSKSATKSESAAGAAPAPSDSLKSILYALGANFVIAVAKFAAAIFTSSGSMLAEAIHSLADCTNQGLLLLGLKTSKRPPSPDFPLGYGKEIYFWSFIVAILLFSVGGVFSIYEGVHKLHSTEPLSYPWLAVGILTFSIVAESFSLWGCMREINKERGQRTWYSWFKESRKSELIVVFGEDIAALFGLVFALIAILITIATGNLMYDAIGSMAIGALLILVAVFIGKEIKDLLIGQSVDAETKNAIHAFIAKQPGVERVFSLVTLQLGQDVMVACKIKMKAPQSNQLIADLNSCEKNLRLEFNQVRWSFFEPDIED